MIRFGINIKLNEDGSKRVLGFPEEWQKMKESKYNNESNYGILTGKENDIIVVDLDMNKKEKTWESVEWYCENICKIEELDTLVTCTPSGGYHIYYKYTEELLNGINIGGVHIDILSDKKCCFQGLKYDVICDLPIRCLRENELKELKKLQKGNDDVEISFVLDNLDIKRAEDYCDWLKVGFGLKELKNGKELFRRFSKRSCKYNEKEFEEKWNSFNKDYSGDKITISTIYSYLKKDNPKKFNELKKSENLIVNQFKKEFENGDIKDITYEKGIVKAKILNNDSIDLKHIRHNSKICNGVLNYNLEASNEIPNQLSQQIKCSKCNFIHPGSLCTDAKIYQLIINYQNENPDNLKLVIPKEYQLQIVDISEINDLLYNSLKQEDLTIQKILYEMYKNEYLCIGNDWYYFNGVIWELLENQQHPLQLLQNVENISKYLNVLYKKHLEEDNLEEKQLKELNSIVNNLSYKLSKNNEDKTFVNNSQKYFGKPKLKFNEKKYLIAFKNGVYNLETFEFRQGRPDDYLSIQLNYNYQDISLDKMNLLKKFLEDILPIENVRNFLMKHIASCLLGQENIEQEFFIMTGKKGANGKSVLTKLIENTFGDYFAAPEPTLITKQREKANEANEAMMDLDGKRIAIMSEPNKRDSILSDNLKKFTGGDTITARGNHKSSKKINMNLKIFMLCNSIPLMDDCKDAEIRRLCIINFPTRFCEKPKAKNEKLIDIQITKKLNECLNEFFQLLISYLKEYDPTQKLKKPKEVTEQLEKYIESNNEDTEEIREFLRETYEKKDGDENRVTCKEVWNSYKAWLALSKKRMLKDELNDLFEEVFELEPGIFVKNVKLWKNMIIKK